MRERYSVGKRIAAIGIAANIALLCLKLIFGYMAGSQAMIADGFNSVGDVFASVVTLFGSIYAAKPEDEDHVFGHGKAEYIAALIIGVSMVGMAIYTISGSVSSLVNQAEMVFSWQLVLVALITIGTKGVLFAYSTHQAKKYGSVLIRANATDHRNDVFVTGGTLIAIIAGMFGVFFIDGVVGLVISCWIIYSGVDIVRDAARVLMDENMTRVEIEKCAGEIETVEGVDHIDSIVAKPVGAQYIMVVKVSVKRDLSVAKSHEIAEEIECRLMGKRPDVYDIIVHINPDFPHGEEI